MKLIRKQRRKFLKIMGVGFVGLSAMMFRVMPASARETIGRSVSMRNLHTGEVYNGIYRVGGYYIPEEFEKINHFMRDHRCGSKRAMDPKLIDIIADIQKRCGCAEPVGLLSGYRTAQTNAMLRKTTSGVAKNSFHVKGRAADIRLTGVNTKSLCSEAMKLKAGGVGYYPKSNFVHVDTGKVRHWSA